jgi:hypothetical protein
MLHAAYKLELKKRAGVSFCTISDFQLTLHKIYDFVKINTNMDFTRIIFPTAVDMFSTFFWLQWYELIEITKQIDLSEKESKQKIEQTLSAALNLMFKSGQIKNEVIDLIPVKPIGEHEQ